MAMDYQAGGQCGGANFINGPLTFQPQQMRRTPAVRRAEPAGHHYPTVSGNGLSPGTFHPLASFLPPNLPNLGRRNQVINVPVQFLVLAQVAPDPCLKPVERAATVQVMAGREVKPPQPANRQLPGICQVDSQDVVALHAAPVTVAVAVAIARFPLSLPAACALTRICLLEFLNGLDVGIGTGQSGPHGVDGNMGGAALGP